MSQNSALYKAELQEGDAFNVVDLDGQPHICAGSFGNDNTVGDFEGVTATEAENCTASAAFAVVVNQADAITDSHGNEYWPYLGTDFTGRPPRTHRPNA